MIRQSRRLLLVYPLCALILGVVGYVSACQVPVFRYALERWQSDKYELLVISEGPLNTEQAELLHALEQTSRQAAESTFTIQHYDVAETSSSKEAKRIWQEQSKDAGPLLAVLYPQNAQVADRLAHCCSFASQPVKRVFDSPVRQSLLSQLLDGDSAVWIFVPCGDADKDQAAEEALAGQLARDAQWVELPSAEELEVTPEVIENAKIELKIHFSTVTLRRDDADEAFVLDALLNSESDLRDFDEPMAFPVFGRGRVLYALIGKGISPDTVRSATSFISGPCSCQVKNQNPGFDMLLSCDWEEAIGETLISEPIAAIPLQPTLLAIPPGKSP